MNFISNLNYTYILSLLAVIVILNCLLGIFRIRVSTIVYANIFLMFIAVFEPAPSDVLFISLLLFAFRDRIILREKYLKMKPVIWPLAAYVIICAVSMFNIRNYYMGFRFFTVTVYLLTYSLLIYFYSNEKNYISILKTYIAGSTTAAILGILGYFGVFSKYLMFDVYRSKALFKDPNVFGPFLIPAVLILLGDIKSKELLKGRNGRFSASFGIFTYIVLITINITGIVISFSRGAWASFAAGILTWFILNIKKINFKRLIILCCTAASIFSVLWFGLLDSSWKDFLLGRLGLKEYDNQRFAAQRAGLSLSLDHVFGYGPGQYEDTVEKIIGEKYSAHSLYIRVILENGIPGFCFLMIPGGYVFIKLLKIHMKGYETVKIKSSTLISILAALLINSLVVDTLHWRHLWLFYGLSMSVVSCYINRPSKLLLKKTEVIKPDGS